MPLVVQKFGGTCLESPEQIKLTAEIIRDASKKGDELVVVVSAMGETTDQLFQLAKTISTNPPSREMDMLLSAGERISMALLSMALAELGVPAISFTGSQVGLITDRRHRSARILRILGDRIEAELRLKKVVIVAGFQGVSESKDVTTLGRGGSDTTAVALAARLEAVRCEIYTDVAGVFSADPRIVDNAKIIDSVSPTSMLRFSHAGASVLHPRSVELAERFGVPVWIGSQSEPSKGSWMSEQRKPGESEAIESTRVLGVSIGVSQFYLTVSSAKPEFLRDAYREFLSKVESGGCILMHCNKDALAFQALVDQADCPTFLAELSEVFENNKEFVFSGSADLVPVTVVGSRLDEAGVLFEQEIESLMKQGVDIRRTWIEPEQFRALVVRDDAAKVLKHLHDRFIGDEIS